MSWTGAQNCRFYFFLCSVCLTQQKEKKKPRMKISWKQGGNNKVGVKVSAVESMYVCSRHVTATRCEIVI